VAGAALDENDIDNQPADVRFVLDALVAPGSALRSRIDVTRVAVAGHSDGAETALAASVAPTPAGQPRIDAVLAMSVSPLPGVASTANPPILVTQGDADDINLPSEGITTWDRAASPRYLMILHGGGHLPPLEAGSAWLPAVERATEAFFALYLDHAGTPAAVVAAGDDAPLTATQSA
jgi:pimeloyl-ACP methyl ester carboxylesterase